MVGSFARSLHSLTASNQLVRVRGAAGTARIEVAETDSLSTLIQKVSKAKCFVTCVCRVRGCVDVADSIGIGAG